jgi:hypothetical protein
MIDNADTPAEPLIPRRAITQGAEAKSGFRVTKTDAMNNPGTTARHAHRPVLTFFGAHVNLCEHLSAFGSLAPPKTRPLAVSLTSSGGVRA